MNALTSAAVALSLALPACFTSVGSWTYPSGHYPTTSSERPAAAFVAVERLLDARSPTNRSSIAWAYVPLSPGGWVHFDRPEATEGGAFTPRYSVDPPEDLAESIAIELRRSGIVERASFAPEGPGAEHTHVLRGVLRTFQVHESRWTYLVSAHAVLLWALGLPVGRSENGFSVDLELVDLADGRVVWRDSIFDADRRVEGLYYGPEWYRFGWMWERRLREKLGALAVALGTTPPPLPEALARELAAAPPRLPECLGVDSSAPCSAP